MNYSTPLSTCTKPLPEELGTVQKEMVGDWLRKCFPNGHPEFLPILLKLAQLHSDKNHDYALGGSPLGNFERVGKIKAMYPEIDWAQPEAVAISYMLKQLDAALWGRNLKIHHIVEGEESRWQDVAVYAMLIICMLRECQGELGTRHEDAS